MRKNVGVKVASMRKNVGVKLPANIKKSFKVFIKAREIQKQTVSPMVSQRTIHRPKINNSSPTAHDKNRNPDRSATAPRFEKRRDGATM